jgi:hypothetical protein
MTTADFLAACFWPLVILFAVLLNTVRDPADRRHYWALNCALRHTVGGLMGLGREPINSEEKRIPDSSQIPRKV